MNTQQTNAYDVLEFETLLFSRTYVYTLLHKLLGGTPNSDLISVLLDQVTSDVVEEYAEANDSMHGFVNFLEKLRGEEWDTLADQAKDEYMRVFVGPAALPASPYESPYKGKHDMSLFQENTLAVREVYRSFGLQPKRVQSVPDDHVALMCAFMVELGDRSLKMFYAGQLDELVTSLREQHAFLFEHMDDWLSVYAASVRNSRAGSAAVLYPQLLEALSAFASIDATFIREATYWLESGECEGSLREPAELLTDAFCVLEKLVAQKPFGIEDVELISLG